MFYIIDITTGEALGSALPLSRIENALVSLDSNGYSLSNLMIQSADDCFSACEYLDI